MAAFLCERSQEYAIPQHKTQKPYKLKHPKYNCFIVLHITVDLVSNKNKQVSQINSDIN